MDPAILDFTRIALEDKEVTKELCLFTFGRTVWRSEVEEDFTPLQVYSWGLSSEASEHKPKITTKISPKITTLLMDCAVLIRRVGLYEIWTEQDNQMFNSFHNPK